MSIDNQSRFDLIQYRLSEAKDTQSDVELLISHDSLSLNKRKKKALLF